MQLSKQNELSNVILDDPSDRWGGVHISLIDSKKMAVAFIYNLQERLAKQLGAGNSLES
jgi:hypothetical protein